MNSDILQPNKPFKYASRNPRTHYKQLRSGEIFLLEVEIDEEVWNQVRTLPKNALMENISWHHDGDPTQPEPILGTTESPSPTKKKKGKGPQGPYSYYWMYMHRQDSLGCNFTTFPYIQELLNVDADHVHEALRAYFKVDSLTTVSPEQFNQFVKDNGLSEGLITMSRNAEAKAAEKQLAFSNQH